MTKTNEERIKELEQELKIKELEEKLREPEDKPSDSNNSESKDIVGAIKQMEQTLKPGKPFQDSDDPLLEASYTATNWIILGMILFAIWLIIETNKMMESDYEP